MCENTHGEHGWNVSDAPHRSHPISREDTAPIEERPDKKTQAPPATNPAKAD